VLKFTKNCGFHGSVCFTEKWNLAVFVPKLNTSLCGSWDTMLFVDTVGTTTKQVAIVWACFAKKRVIGYVI